MRRAFDDPFSSWPWPRGQRGRRRAWPEPLDPRWDRRVPPPAEPAPVEPARVVRPRVVSPPVEPRRAESLTAVPLGVDRDVSNDDVSKDDVSKHEPPRRREESSLRVAKARVAYEDELSRAKERVARDAERQVEIARRHVIEDFIEVLDDLERALDAPTSASESAMQSGVEMVRDRFLAKLRAHGVTRVEARGATFDPRFHEAVSVVRVAPEDADRVVEVLRQGYVIGQDVLRPAAVVVGRPEVG